MPTQKRAVKYNPNIHHRRSIRLKGYDYSQPGAYYVTICTQHREAFLCDVVKEITKFTVRGAIARQFWFQIPNRFANVKLDKFVVMPNHIHGIIWITDDGTGTNGRGVETTPLPKHSPTLGQIIAYYKYQTTKIINNIDRTSGNRIWQRNYYEKIIPDEKALNNIRRYIVENPLCWEKDSENPINAIGAGFLLPDVTVR